MGGEGRLGEDAVSEGGEGRVRLKGVELIVVVVVSGSVAESRGGYIELLLSVRGGDGLEKCSRETEEENLRLRLRDLSEGKMKKIWK